MAEPERETWATFDDQSKNLRYGNPKGTFKVTALQSNGSAIAGEQRMKDGSVTHRVVGPALPPAGKAKRIYLALHNVPASDRLTFTLIQFFSSTKADIVFSQRHRGQGKWWAMRQEEAVDQVMRGVGPLMDAAQRGDGSRGLKVIANAIEREVRRHTHLKAPRNFVPAAGFSKGVSMSMSREERSSDRR